MSKIILRVIGIWILFVVVALLNAGIRELLLAPVIGEKLALPVSGILLSIFIFLITLRLVIFLHISGATDFWLVGIVWAFLTLLFEFLFGYYMVSESWERLLAVFNILEGDLFILVLLVTAVSPYIAAKIRALI
jgi:hypothetical protein